MKKILCPTDFSDTAQNAIAYAAKLAQTIGAQLTLFNVQSMFELTAMEVIRGKGLTIEAYEERLKAQSLEVSTAFKISCYAEVQPSTASLSKTIANRAVGYDLIVMGTNGTEDLTEFLRGSHSYNAVLKTNVPALIIPQGVMFSEIKNIVYAFNYLRERNLSIEQLIPFANILKSNITILQVAEEGTSKMLDKDLEEMQFILKEKYGDKVALSFDTIKSAEISQSINSYIRRNSPDAVAVCTVHRNFLEGLFHKSVIKNLSAISEYPVFVFHK